MKIIARLLPLIFVLNGCATPRAATDINSFRDPDYVQKTFRKVLVMAVVSDSNVRAKIEKLLVWELSEHAADGIAAVDLFPPTRDYSKEDMAEGMKKNGIDGVLTIAVIDSQEKQEYVPGKSVAYGYADAWYGYARYAHVAREGHYITKDSFKFDVRLIDPATEKTAWLAQPDAFGNANTSADVFLKAITKSIADKITQDGMLKKTWVSHFGFRVPVIEPDVSASK